MSIKVGTAGYLCLRLDREEIWREKVTRVNRVDTFVSGASHQLSHFSALEKGGIFRVDVCHTYLVVISHGA